MARSKPSHRTRRSSRRREVQVAARLSEMALRLRGIVATTITSELALRKLNCEQDMEVADCLRAGVCDPLDAHVRELKTLIGQIGGKLPEPLR